MNLLLVCDELTGEAVYAYEYNGSINDKGSMAPILDHMEASGFDLKNVTIVSDRGYKTLFKASASTRTALKSCCESIEIA